MAVGLPAEVCPLHSAHHPEHLKRVDRGQQRYWYVGVGWDAPKCVCVLLTLTLTCFFLEGGGGAGVYAHKIRYPFHSVVRPGADDFLPVFIYILTLSKLHRPATCLTYIQCVHPRAAVVVSEALLAG